MEISLQLPNYNVETAEAALIQQVAKDHPDATVAQLSTLLGVSERNLYRLFTKHKIPVMNSKKKELIETLRREGFKIEYPTNLEYRQTKPGPKIKGDYKELFGKLKTRIGAKITVKGYHKSTLQTFLSTYCRNEGFKMRCSYKPLKSGGVSIKRIR